ncbi:hypothetical protein AB7M35_000938 [Amorphus suaedae]
MLGSALRIVAVLGAMTLGVSTSYAQWTTDVTDDLFSDNKNASMVGMINFNSGMYLSCSGPEKLTFSYIERGDWEPGMDGVPAKLIVQVDGGEKHALHGVFYDHNADFYGVESDEVDKIRPIVAAIRDAKSKIMVGLLIESSGRSYSASVSVNGSTRAASRFIEACNIDLSDPGS